MKKATFPQKSFREQLCYLSKREIEAIRKANVGYGNLRGNALKVGIHENTYRYLLDRGYGKKETVEKIRTLLKPILR